MRLGQRTRWILSWVLTMSVGVGVGLIAAHFRLLDNVAVTIGLMVLIVVLITIGFKAMAQPWDE